MILIITSKRDEHIGWVSRHLDLMGQPWVRLNSEDLPTLVNLSIDPAGGQTAIQIRDSGRSFELNDVTAVWYRKPDPVDLSHFGMEKAGLDYIEAEFNEVLHGLYALLNDVFWINNPLTTRLAHRKMLQLRVAKQVGLSTPPTIVTNRSEDALRFAERFDWNLAIKSLGAISVSGEVGQVQKTHYGIFTRKIGKEELLSLQDKIRFMPTLFQKYIEKEYELRVTCVGDKVFSCRIFSQSSDLAREDFRFDTPNLRHEAYDCPELHEPLLKYMDILGINFGCFDLARSSEGKYIFFECNPNGQWLWVEEMTGLPIGRAIADELFMASTRGTV